MSRQSVDYCAMLALEIRRCCIQDRPYVIHVAEVTVEMRKLGAKWVAQLTTTGGYFGSYTRVTWEAAHIEILVDAERHIKGRIPASAWFEDETRGELTAPCSIVVSTEVVDTVVMKRLAPHQGADTPPPHDRRTAGANGVLPFRRRHSM